jgi:hypothetical protein
MIWRNHGLLFGPEALGGNQEASFSQGPQVLTKGETNRVYFSVRTLDRAGEVRSTVRYADFSHDFSTILGISPRDVIGLGNLGCFDEHGIFPMNVVSADELIYGYSCGWSRRRSVPIEMAIGRVVSADGGESFSREFSGPVLGASQHEPFLVGDPCVVFVNDIWHMWYIFGTRWTESPDGVPERTYRIGHRTSDDGLFWTTHEPGKQIIQELTDTEAQAMPSVVILDGLAYMFFCFRDTFDFRSNSANSYRIGLAVSKNLEDWKRIPFDCRTFSGEWDSEMACYPNVHVQDGEVRLLYNGNNFGKSGFGMATTSVKELQDYCQKFL